MWLRAEDANPDVFLYFVHGSVGVDTFLELLHRHNVILYEEWELWHLELGPG